MDSLDNIPSFIIFIAVVPIIGLSLSFRDYKVIINDNGLELFSLFKIPHRISWSDIVKIEVKKSYRGRLYGMETIITFYTEHSKHNFNVYLLDNKIHFFEKLMKNSITRDIEVVDLTGDVTKFFTQIELRLFNFINKFVRPLKKDH